MNVCVDVAGTEGWTDSITVLVVALSLARLVAESGGGCAVSSAGTDAEVGNVELVTSAEEMLSGTVGVGSNTGSDTLDGSSKVLEDCVSSTEEVIMDVISTTEERSELVEASLCNEVGVG